MTLDINIFTQEVHTVLFLHYQVQKKMSHKKTQ